MKEFPRFVCHVAWRPQSPGMYVAAVYRMPGGCFEAKRKDAERREEERKEGEVRTAVEASQNKSDGQALGQPLGSEMAGLPAD